MSSESDRERALDVSYRTGSRRRKALGLIKEEERGAVHPALAHRRTRGRSTCRCARGYPLCGEQESSDTVDDMLAISSRWADNQLVNAFLSFSTGDHRTASLFDREMSCAFAHLQLLGQPLTNRYERDWQRQCNEKIQDCAFLICLVGRITHRSTAVAWEVGRAIELAKPVLPIALHALSAPLPGILRANSIPPLSFCNCLTHSDVFARIFELTK